MKTGALSRPFDGVSDLRRMRVMLAGARASAEPGYWHVGDLTWRYFLLSIRSDVRQNIRLWEDGAGTLLGFAWIDFHNSGCDWQVRPEARHGGLEAEMLAWIEARHREFQEGPAGGEAKPLETGAMADDLDRIMFLESHGFKREGAGLVHFTRSLRDPLPKPSLPPGYEVRGIAGKHEAAARAAAHRQAFHPSRVSDESYLRLMDLPGYDAALDVVAIAPDGSVAAYAMGWVDEVNKVGEFEPVGTVPIYQRLGLGRALQLEGLRRMRAAGAETAIVATWAEWEAPKGLYLSAGFEIVNHEFDFIRSKKVSAHEP